jgi:oligopeptidase B
MTTQTPTPPVAKRIPKADTIHGDTRIDDYFWMREKSNPEVIAYLKAENAYTDAVMAPTKALQETLYQEIKGRIQETDLSVPYRYGGYWYYSRTEEGKQYPILCRKAGGLDAEEEVTLDLNTLAEGHSYLGLGTYSISDDARLLAYAIDVTGFREYTLYVKDLHTGELLPDRIEKVGNVAWAADNQTLFYTTEDDAKRSYRLLGHELGGTEDALLYEETDALFSVGLSRSRSRAYLFLTSNSSNTSEVRFLPSDTPHGDFRLVQPRETKHRYYLDHWSDRFFIRTDKDAINFRIVWAPLADPSPTHWTEFLAHDPAILREDMDFFARHAVISERESGLENLRIIDLTTDAEHRLAFPEPVYAASLDANPEFDTIMLRFRYQSLITPPSVFDEDMATRERILLKQTPVLGGYDPSLYVSERISATASDGTQVPMSLVRRRDTALDGTSPLLLYGYGSYGLSIPPGFSSSRLSLLDRGVVFVLAHIRGGGDLGEQWRQAGKMAVKRNTFTDFIACAEDLIARHCTSPNRLMIQGGSAGGLLMGAVVNMRPELFRAVLSQVPFVDVLNTMLDDTLPLTVGEYLEWGNPNIADEYAVMRNYSPYDNIAAKAYPAMLVKTSLNDSQVMYWEAA